MTKRNHILGILLLAAGLLAGCSHDDPEVRPAQDEIAVHTGVTSMQKRIIPINNDAALQTKALKIEAYFHGTTTAYIPATKMVYDEGAWKFWSNGEPGEQVHYYWPLDGAVYNPTSDNITYSSLDFVGYCPFDAPAYITPGAYSAVSGVSFSCDMSGYMTLASQAAMPEYLIAVLPEQTKATQTAAGGALPLSFKHPLALVKFVITAASGTHVQINSISIADLHTGGTCSYNGTAMTWGTYTGSGTMEIAQTLKTGETTETGEVAVIPADYGEKYLTVNATWDDWSNVTISDYGANVTFNWEPGHSYTYNLTLDKNGLKVDAAKFTEQW